MKRYLPALIFLPCVLMIGCMAGYVSKRPADIAYARPRSPGHGYVWTTGEWQYSRGHYQWRDGSWQKSRQNQTWKPGYWEKNTKGYRWHKGEWKKRG